MAMGRLRRSSGVCIANQDHRQLDSARDVSFLFQLTDEDFDFAPLSPTSHAKVLHLIRVPSSASTTEFNVGNGIYLSFVLFFLFHLPLSKGTCLCGIIN